MTRGGAGAGVVGTKGRSPAERTDDNDDERDRDGLGGEEGLLKRVEPGMVPEEAGEEDEEGPETVEKGWLAIIIVVLLYFFSSLVSIAIV